MSIHSKKIILSIALIICLQLNCISVYASPEIPNQNDNSVNKNTKDDVCDEKAAAEVIKRCREAAARGDAVAMYVWSWHELS